MIGHVREIFKYRALIYALVVRHLSIRYRGSVLGFLWSLLNPLCLMMVYTLVFHFYLRFSQVEHYTIFLFCGLLPWIWISSALAEGTAAIAGSGHLITKSMFPAQILPLVSVLTTLVNFLLSLPLLVIFMVCAGVPLHLSLLALPVLVGLQLIFLYGMTLMLSSVNVFYRDVQHLVGNVLSLLFFLCPIVYPPSSVPERYHFTLEVNPFALFVSSYHGLIMEGIFPSMADQLSLFAWGGIACILGNLTFQRYREGFAEML